MALDFCGARFCAAVAEDWIGFRKALRDDPGVAELMVEGDDDIVKAECEAGDLEFVEARLGKTLEAARKIVGEESGCAALERREIGERGGGEGFETVLDSLPNRRVVGCGGD